MIIIPGHGPVGDKSQLIVFGNPGVPKSCRCFVGWKGSLRMTGL